MTYTVISFCFVCFIFYRGKGGTENSDHEVTLELFAAIDPDVSIVD